VVLAIVDAFAKFKERKSVASSQKRSRDSDHALFGGIFLTPAVGFAVFDALAKFKECSFIHSRNIDGVKSF